MSTHVVTRCARQAYRRIGGLSPRVLARFAHRAGRRDVREALRCAKSYEDFETPGQKRVTGHDVC